MSAEEELREVRAQAEPTGSGEETSPQAPDLREELARKEKQIFDIEGQFRRLAADFENTRRRHAQEREELIKFAASRVCENLLPVVDNLERAIVTSQKATDMSQVIIGVEMIFRQMLDALTKAGVVAMEAKGQIFDPNIHEAIAQLETSEHLDQMVLEELQKGYYLNGKVLRYARVQIASNPNAPATKIEADAAQSNKEDNHG